MSETYEIDYYPHDWKTTWITKDGDYIPYEYMSDNHLLNAHRMVSNKCVDFTNKCMSENCERDLPQYVLDAIAGLETELNKRGLLQ